MRMNLVFTSLILLFVGCNSHDNLKKPADINTSHNDSCSMKEETSVYSNRSLGDGAEMIRSFGYT